MSRVLPIEKKKKDHLGRKTALAPSGCVLWTGRAKQDGYGEMRFEHGAQRASFAAHRVAYELAYGTIPTGKFVCHSCDVKMCCNPDHLFLGDAKINNADMDAKGRRRVSGCSELQTLVLDLLRAGEPAHQIRKRLGVPQSQIYRRAYDLWIEQNGAPK
jgi:hypothetical protein